MSKKDEAMSVRMNIDSIDGIADLSIKSQVKTQLIPEHEANKGLDREKRMEALGVIPAE